MIFCGVNFTFNVLVSFGLLDTIYRLGTSSSDPILTISDISDSDDDCLTQVSSIRFVYCTTLYIAIVPPLCLPRESQQKIHMLLDKNVHQGYICQAAIPGS